MSSERTMRPVNKALKLMGKSLACSALGPPFEAVDAQKVAKAICVQHAVQKVTGRVKYRHRRSVGGGCIICQILWQAQRLLAAPLHPYLHQGGNVAMRCCCLWRGMHRNDEVDFLGAHRMVLPACA